MFHQHVLWTPLALGETWNQLRNIRAGGVLGSISLYLESASFHVGRVARTAKGSDKTREGRREWIKVGCEGTMALKIRSLLANIKVKDNLVKPVAPKSGSHNYGRMSTREPAAAHSAVTPTSEPRPSVPGSEQPGPSTRKCLGAARLVYVDETGRPLFVS